MAHTCMLVLLTGPAGAGKSTAAAAWAARGSTPRAVIDVDTLRLNIRAGVALPEHGWNAETERQWVIAAELWTSMLAVYYRYNVSCVVDLYAPPAPDESWKALYTTLGLRRVVLLPSYETCHERNRVRNRQPLLSDADLQGNYDDFSWCVDQHTPDHYIDNTDLTVAETVDAIEAELAQPARP